MYLIFNTVNSEELVLFPKWIINKILELKCELIFEGHEI